MPCRPPRRKLERKCSDNASRIGDPTRCDDGDLHRIDDLWYEREGADLACGICCQKHPAMASSFKALSNDGITTFALQPSGLRYRRCRRHDACAGSAHALNEAFRRQAEMKAH